jgi:hypothetical protein
LKIALGIGAGYSLSRALEARAAGVPLSVAFSFEDGARGLLTPVSLLRPRPQQQIVVGDQRPPVVEGTVVDD